MREVLNKPLKVNQEVNSLSKLATTIKIYMYAGLTLVLKMSKLLYHYITCTIEGY